MAPKKSAQKNALAQFKGEEVEASVKDEGAGAGRSVADFRKVLDDRRRDLEPMLPEGVRFERLRATALEAVRQNPELLRCDARSLLGAISKAAYDGLLPDGREGVITHYKDRRTGRLLAGWNPMAAGFRKRARELDSIIVDADVVRANDTFDHQGGDNPYIIHKRPPLGHKRGDMIGAYAIYRQGGGILHREVMDLDEINAARAQSRQPDGLMWTKFPWEAFKKTVVRRGFKSVPCSERLTELINRDDETGLDLEPGVPQVLEHAPRTAQEPEGEPEPEEAPANGKAQEAPTEAKKGARKGKGAAKGAKAGKAAKGATEAAQEPEGGKLSREAAADQASQPTASAVRTAMWKAKNPEALAAVWNESVAPYDWPKDELAAIERTYQDRQKKIEAANA